MSMLLREWWGHYVHAPPPVAAEGIIIRGIAQAPILRTAPATATGLCVCFLRAGNSPRLKLWPEHGFCTIFSRS
jgi:hypothetical protein